MLEFNPSELNIDIQPKITNLKQKAVSQNKGKVTYFWNS